MDFKKLVKKIKEYNPNANFELIRKAYEFADEMHKNEKRASGEPYIQHPLETAYILAELKLDDISIAASLLHDVLENTKLTPEDIKAKFGEEIGELVDGVTKLSKIKYHDRQERDAESIRKMFLATVKDVRVLLIKLADKLHNMRTLSHLTQEQQQRISQATLDIYAPLAHRLGIASIKWELEDIAFKYLNPEMYAKFREKFGKKRLQREIEIRKIIKLIEKELKKQSIPSTITGRPKHFYSIYRKMIIKRRKFEELYDLMALRIITDTVKHCYEILGILHMLWKPIPGEFDDYIAMPKANMYQSLHTAVIGSDGQPIEIQIRTEDMHRISEEGIAAHWAYKGLKGDSKFDKKLSWLRQILDWQRGSKSAKEFMDVLKVDFFQDEIYVFTPKGRVICLPKGSTPIDFAYEIHSNVGDSCTGAIVNGRIVPLRHELKNGDIVHILTSKKQIPRGDWLKIVKTSRARAKIKHYLRLIKKIPIISKVKKEPKKEPLESSIIDVETIPKAKVKFAKCCHPLPGEQIIGFFIPPNRITIHNKDCVSIKNIKKERLNVAWKKSFNKPIEIKILAMDRVGLFADILNTVASTGTNVTGAKGRTKGEEMVEISFGMVPEDLEHLKDILDRIMRVNSIKRVFLDETTK